MDVFKFIIFNGTNALGSFSVASFLIFANLSNIFCKWLYIPLSTNHWYYSWSCQDTVRTWSLPRGHFNPSGTENDQISWKPLHSSSLNLYIFLLLILRPIKCYVGHDPMGCFWPPWNRKCQNISKTVEIPTT